MKPSMLQRQVTEPVDVFRRVLVFGEPKEAALLLRQALPVIANAADVYLLEPHPRHGADRSLDAILLHLERNGARIRRDSLDGRSDIKVLERAAQGHDLVLKATAPGGPHGSATDALDQELLARCPSTIWFGRYGRSVAMRRIAAAVDCRDDDESARVVGERVLTLAGSLAAATGAELHLVHAWFLFGAEVLKSHVPDEELRLAAEWAEAEARRRLSALLHRLPHAPVDLRQSDRVHTVKGVPERALTGFLNTREIDLVVVGTRGRKGRLARKLFPQIASQLLPQTWCSVVVVKPDRASS